MLITWRSTALSLHCTHARALRTFAHCYLPLHFCTHCTAATAALLHAHLLCTTHAHTHTRTFYCTLFLFAFARAHAFPLRFTTLCTLPLYTTHTHCAFALFALRFYHTHTLPGEGVCGFLEGVIITTTRKSVRKEGTLHSCTTVLAYLKHNC